MTTGLIDLFSNIPQNLKPSSNKKATTDMEGHDEPEEVVKMVTSIAA